MEGVGNGNVGCVDEVVDIGNGNGSRLLLYIWHSSALEEHDG